jgi:hypothetical protein
LQLGDGTLDLNLLSFLFELQGKGRGHLWLTQAVHSLKIWEDFGFVILALSGHQQLDLGLDLDHLLQIIGELV